MTTKTKTDGPATKKIATRKKRPWLKQRSPKVLKWMKGKHAGFVLSCTRCDAGEGVPTAMAALCTGWTGLSADNGPSWNFLGFCPDCLRESEEKYEKHVREDRRRVEARR